MLRAAIHPEAKFFFYSSKAPYGQMATSSPNFIMKRWLTKIGIDPVGYGSHSGRKGGASAAASRHIEKRVLQRHVNWRSDAVNLYIEDDVEELLTCSKAILECE